MSTLDEFHALEQRLTVAGYSQWASRIEDCITSAATGSELWMCVAENLRELNRAEGALPPEIRNEVQRLVASIDQVLGP